MTTTAPDVQDRAARTTDYDAQDVEYLRHGDQSLLARVFTPRGSGPFPALVEVHGGAWCLSDRKTEHLRHEFMASRGIVSFALDFRSGETDPYPASLQDINFAVRFLKLHAREFKTQPRSIGLSGQSSGGHLAMLAAMRPYDPRYAAIALPSGAAHDATVRAVVMSWPVINPLSRYRHARRALAAVNAPEWPKSIIARHDSYWRSEANMAEGNPMLALERSEKVQTPPAIWFQGRGDTLHDYKDADSDFPGNEPQRFVANYRKAGGEIELHYLDMDRHAGHAPDLSKTGDMFDRMVEWVGRHIAVGIL
ncbi:MAG TPA: alpha/beta hydrolase [Xanthobacteraceae bacterium]|nr:alpha/beta hydrolase [Xanthobacteraceae bacterium]